MNYSTVVLQGEEYPFALGIGSFEKFKEITGKNFFAAIQDFQNSSTEDGQINYEKFDFSTLTALAFVGLKTGGYRAGKPFDMDYEAVGYMVGIEDMASLMEAMAEEFGQEEEGKQKAAPVAASRQQKRKSSLSKNSKK